MWTLSHRADPAAVAIADRHYNRQKIGSPQFVPPGRCLVLIRDKALWVTSWPFSEYVKHAWGGAWVNSIFRREDGAIASEMIREALAATRWRWQAVPFIRCPYCAIDIAMVSFIDRDKTRPKRDPGRCYTENVVKNFFQGFLVKSFICSKPPIALPFSKIAEPSS